MLATGDTTNTDSVDVFPMQKDSQPDPPLRRSTRVKKKSIRLQYPSEQGIQSKYLHATKVLLLDNIYQKILTTSVMRHESPDNIHFPRVHKLIHAPIKPETPPHIGAALKSKNVGDWIDCLFAAYDKMHRTGTLSLPFPQTQLDKDTAILRPRLTCEVRITDSDNYYELKVRLCADGSRMVVGID